MVGIETVFDNLNKRFAKGHRCILIVAGKHINTSKRSRCVKCNETLEKSSTISLIESNVSFLNAMIIDMVVFVYDKTNRAHEVSMNVIKQRHHKGLCIASDFHDIKSPGK